MTAAQPDEVVARFVPGAAADEEWPELWWWGEILDKRKADIRSRLHYDGRIAYLDKLLALRDMCPASRSPADAARRLGINLDEYLERAA